MDTNVIKQQLIQIIDELIPLQNSSVEEKLILIGSESIRMVAFLSAIENEWDIEIDDDLINRDFFLNIDIIIAAIEKTLISECNR